MTTKEKGYLALGTAVGFASYALLRESVEAGTLPGTGMALKDWATVSLSFFAFTLSLLAFNYNRRKEKRDAFLSIHEKLIAFDIQQGRSILFNKVKSVKSAERLERRNVEEFQKVNRALSMYDVLGLYVDRGYVDKSLVMAEWGHNLARARENALHFMNHRKKRWDHFEALSEEAFDLLGDELDPEHR